MAGQPAVVLGGAAVVVTVSLGTVWLVQRLRERSPAVSGALDAAAQGMASVRTRLGLSTNYMARMGGWLLLFIAFFITSDIITRKLFLFSSKATDEMSNYALAAATSWGMAYALLTKAHVRVDVLLVRFSREVQGYLCVFALLLMNFIVAYIVYLAWVEVVFFSFEIGAQAPTIARTPLAWPQSIWAVGLSVFFLMSFVVLVESVVDLMRGGARQLPSKIGPLSVLEEVEEALEAAGLEGVVLEGMAEEGEGESR